MNRGDLSSHIRKSWELAKALKIDEVFSGPSALEASAVFKALSVNSNSSYEEIYLAGLRESQYNILLRDYSYFQFGVNEEDEVRFAYYPNPFLGASVEAVADLQEMQEFVSEGIIGVDEFLHRVSEIRQSQHPPLVRYEYSKRQYVEMTHPCSHMHLGFHGENRWPVRRHLSADAFCLMIFRLFYLNFWVKADNIKQGTKKLTMDEVLKKTRDECRILYDEEFSEKEGHRFHFI